MWVDAQVTSASWSVTAASAGSWCGCQPRACPAAAGGCCRVQVGDLGVAKALNKASHAQTVIGTPLYMAPEVWRGLKYSYSSDLWSLGGVLYEMMTHR